MYETALAEARRWLSQPIDNETRAAIEALLPDRDRLTDAFYRPLEFGTGGMRGIMGVGSNRVNSYTIGAATQGLANYLKQAAAAPLSVAIAYDCRHNSEQLARVAANVLSANGIKVYLCAHLRPTPVLSFAVRHYRCSAGIVITASHNPPEYNGYKVYWADGAQIVAPHDKGIVDAVAAIASFSEVNTTANHELIHLMGAELDQNFEAQSLAQRRYSKGSEVGIAFSSLHGTSITLLPQLLHSAGYANVHIVAEQSTPDGNFSTVKSPNPEEPEAMAMVLDLALKHNAEVALATDPDSDRIGVAVRTPSGQMVLLNGNQCGALLMDYLLEKDQDSGRLHPTDFVAYTIVSSNLFSAVAAHYGVHSEVCLTGFKYIADQIRRHEGARRFVGGGEESYGFMIGDFVRDKDALTSALIFCDMAAEEQARGSSAFHRLVGLYRRHGFFMEHLESLTKKGISGATEIAAMMERYRGNTPTQLGGETVVAVVDIERGERLEVKTGRRSKLALPKSNVLQFETHRGSTISVRPSGTEPKIKFYFSVRAPWNEGLSLAEHEREPRARIAQMMVDLGLS